MKLSQFGRTVLAVAALAAMSITITACSVGHTVAFLYVATAKASPGSIYGYKIDQASGTLTQMPDSPFPSGGRNPVAEAVTPNGLNLYVANHDDSDIVWNSIGTDGKIYAECTVDIPDSTSYPTAMAIDPAGKFLFVAYTYQAGYTNSVPGPGGIAVFSIGSGTTSPAITGQCTGSGSLTPIGVFAANGELSPVGITVTADNFVYLATSGKSIQSPGVAQIILNPVLFGYSLNTTTGALTQVTSITYPIGAQPSAVISDTSTNALYVADMELNELYAYSIGAGGALTAVGSGTYTSGIGPDAMAINTTTTPHYLYVANNGANDISIYSIGAGGALTALPAGNASTNQTGTQPNAILVDPALGFYLYTSNFIDNTVTGKQMNTLNGSLINVQFTPFTTGGEPTALAATTSQDVAQ